MGFRPIKTEKAIVETFFEAHGSGKREVSPNKFDAIFLESPQIFRNKEEIEYNLNQHKLSDEELSNIYYMDEKGYNDHLKLVNIFKEAKESGTELWFGDFELPPKSSILWVPFNTSGIFAIRGKIRLREPLRKLLSAYSRKISKFPSVELRNAVWSIKINRGSEILASEKGRNVRIAVLAGAGHASLPEHLKDTNISREVLSFFKPKKEQLLQTKENLIRAVILHRAVYDKEKGKWVVITRQFPIW